MADRPEHPPHQRVAVARGLGNPEMVYAETGLSNTGMPYLSISYVNPQTRQETTYGVDAQGHILTGQGFSTPANPAALLHDAHHILTTADPRFLEGERQRIGFDAAAHQRLLQGVEEAMDKLPPSPQGNFRNRI